MGKEEFQERGEDEKHQNGATGWNKIAGGWFLWWGREMEPDREKSSHRAQYPQCVMVVPECTSLTWLASDLTCHPMFKVIRSARLYCTGKHANLANQNTLCPGMQVPFGCTWCEGRRNHCRPGMGSCERLMACRAPLGMQHGDIWSIIPNSEAITCAFSYSILWAFSFFFFLTKFCPFERFFKLSVLLTHNQNNTDEHTKRTNFIFPTSFPDTDFNWGKKKVEVSLSGEGLSTSWRNEQLSSWFKRNVKRRDK